MRRTRIYCREALEQALSAGDPVRLDARNNHYLVNVLRIAVGDTLTLFDGSGSDYVASVQSINRRQIELQIAEKLDCTASGSESPLQTVLALGISKGERMDFAIQKSVELGVNTIQPLITERVNTNKDAARLGKKREHWQSVVISACEQSGRSVVPRVELPVKYERWLASPEVEDDIPALNLTFQAGGVPLVDVLRNRERVRLARLLIGPEGGLSDSEIQAAQIRGFAGVGLGPRVLRTETAPLVAMALLQAYLGDMA